MNTGSINDHAIKDDKSIIKILLLLFTIFSFSVLPKEAQSSGISLGRETFQQKLSGQLMTGRSSVNLLTIMGRQKTLVNIL